MLSLPIPYKGARHRLGQVCRHGVPLAGVAASLTRGRVDAETAVHLDPDLCHGDLCRAEGWRPAFGQLGAAQAHLARHRIGPGDLFLFFGWFRQAEPAGRAEPGGPGWRYAAGSPDLHALFGWLQVGAVLAVGADLAGHRRRHPGLADHPHLNAHAVPGNTVYVAADRLRVAGRDLGPGAGTFARFHDGLRLSMPGRTRTVWELPGWMLPSAGPALSYHQDPSRWHRHAPGRCTLRTVAQGQEFVLDGAPCLALAAEWIAGLLA